MKAAIAALGAAALVLGGCAAVPGAAVPGMAPTGGWRAVEIGGAPAIGHVTLSLAPEGRIGGRACNHIGGTYELPAPGRIRFGPITATRMLCQPEAIMEQERRFAQILAAATSYSIAGEGTLVLAAPDGRAVRFVRDPAAGGL